MNLTQLHELQNAGWDISSHTYNHNDNLDPNKTDYILTLNDEAQISELNDSYTWLVNNNFQKTAGSIAYPFGSFDDRLINNVKNRYIFGRATVDGSAQPHFTSDDDSGRYVQRKITVHDDTPLQTIKDQLEDTINAKLLGIILFHSIENSNPNNDDGIYLTSDFQRFSDYIKSRSADIDIITPSDLVIPNINDYTPVVNKTTTIFSNGSVILKTKNKYDEYMPNMTIKPLSGSIDVNVTTYKDKDGFVIFNESGQDPNLQVSYDIGDRIPNQTYLVEIYWDNGTLYNNLNVMADDKGHLKYNSTGFSSPRYQK